MFLMGVEITCIKKDDRLNPHERITHIGCSVPNGKSWMMTQENAIKEWKKGIYGFYVGHGDDMVDVVVKISRFGNEYLVTKPDDEDTNNLLYLPEC